MPVFDDIDRTYTGNITAGESHFAYLNRSARPEFDKIRQFITGCFEQYPADHKGELAARIRSDNRTHEAAIFELVVHELLIRAGHSIIAVEPRLEHTTKSPDFLVESPFGERFYLECALATGQTDSAAAAERRLQHALDAAESVSSPNHILSVEVDGRPESSITLSRLKEELGGWIGTLPMGTESKNSDPFRYEEHGFSLKFTVWKHRDAAAAEDARSLGIISYGVRSSTPGADLRGAILRKAKRYGDLGAPYVVAVNTLEIRSFEQELFDALLGTPRMVFRTYEDGRTETLHERDSDGVWTDGSHPRKRGLSALWSFDGLRAWKPWARNVELVRNPWASHPLPSMNLLAEEWNPVDGEFKKSGATTTRETLGLSEQWPEGD